MIVIVYVSGEEAVVGYYRFYYVDEVVVLLARSRCTFGIGLTKLLYILSI